MNKRLAKDHLADQDPVYPKVIFPSSVQCPKCYSITDENSWNTDEVASFLMSYYSKRNIIGLDPGDKSAGNRIDYEVKDAGQANKSSDFLLILIFVLIVLTTFGVMYYFFNYIRTKPKLKKHII